MSIIDSRLWYFNMYSQAIQSSGGDQDLLMYKRQIVITPYSWLITYLFILALEGKF